MQMLPYLNLHNDNKYELEWTHGAGDDEFLLSGRFADMRVDSQLEECRGPLYALYNMEEVVGWDEPGGKYMKPDYVCLSLLGNHGAVVVLNVRDYNVWTIDQEYGGSVDPILRGVDKDVSNNENSLDNHPSRPARDMLKYYIQKFIDLEWIPGGLGKGAWEGDNYVRTYVENGWPDNFDRSGFQVARVKWGSWPRRAPQR